MSEDREDRQKGTQDGQSSHPRPERPVEQDGYVAATDEGKIAERTEEEDRADD